MREYKILKTVLLFICLGCLLWMSGCGLNLATSTNNSAPGPTADLILVELAPSDRPYPEVFLKGREAVCRRGKPDQVPGLEDELETRPAENNNNGTQSTADGEATEGASNPAQSTQPPAPTFTITQVGDNWFSLGLHFANNSDFFLVIDQLAFKMSGHWGTSVLSGQDEIGSGYCGTDPLYIIPPKVRRRYEPSRKNYVNNLTLYVDSVPIPTGPPISESANNNATAGTLAGQQGTGRLGNQQSATGGIGTQNQGGQAANQPPPLSQNDEYILTSLPSYRVQLILYGYFITDKGMHKANFRKSIVFYTTSQFIQ